MFIFTLLWCFKMFYNFLRSHKKVKINILVSCFSLSGTGTGRVEKKSQNREDKTLAKNTQGNYVVILISFLKKKTLEFMKTVGLNMTAFWLSWFIIYAIIILISCIISTIISSGEDHVTIKLCYLLRGCCKILLQTLNEFQLIN